MPLRIHFQELPHSENVRSDCEARVAALQEQFPETLKYEVTLTLDGSDHLAHVHVTGRDLEIASQGRQHALHEAIAEAFERVHRQLRKRHDKQIFKSRRDAPHRG
jgi:ribosomal subunit interface protein